MNKEKQKIKEDLDKYENELSKLYFIHKEEKQRILKELDNKNILFKELGAIYEKALEELLKELDNKNISLNKYKEKLDSLNNKHNQEIRESNIKNKNEALKKLMN